MIRVMALSMALLLCFGCAGTEVDNSWEMTPNNAAAFAKYREIIVDVQKRADMHLGKNVCKRLNQRIEDCIATEFPDRFLPVESKTALSRSLYLQVVITRYDNGSDFSTWSFQPPVNMLIDCKVTVSDWQTKKKLAEFEVSKTYDRTNSKGRSISIGEFEHEFAQEVITAMTQQDH